MMRPAHTPKTSNTAKQPQQKTSTASGSGGGFNSTTDKQKLATTGGSYTSPYAAQKEDKPKPAIKRCIVEGCKMNQVAVHDKKNTFRSLIGLELEEIFRGKEDDVYIDELISKKLNINNFYEAEGEDKDYFADFSFRRGGGSVLEEKLLKNFTPIEKLCGFHQFFLMKHKELKSALQASHAQNRSSPDTRLKVVLASYRKFCLRFWQEASFKLYYDLELLCQQISNVFADIPIMKMSTAQLEIAGELLTTLSVFAAKHRLNEVVNYFNMPSCRYIGNNMVDSYVTTAKAVINQVVAPNLKDVMEICSTKTLEKRSVWLSVLQLVATFSNEVTESHLAELKPYNTLAEQCFTSVFLVESNHQGTPAANDLLFYSLTVFVHGLYSSTTQTYNGLQELLAQSKQTLEVLFLRKVDTWSKALLEAFIVMIFTNFGDEVYAGFLKLPKYRVLKKYHDDGYEDLTSEKFVLQESLEVLHKIEELKYVVSLEVQELIDNYVSFGDPEPIRMMTGMGFTQPSEGFARVPTNLMATNSSGAFGFGDTAS